MASPNNKHQSAQQYQFHAENSYSPGEDIIDGEVDENNDDDGDIVEEDEEFLEEDEEDHRLEPPP